MGRKPPIDIEQLERALAQRERSMDLASALTDFGEILLDEVRGRTGQIDAKALATVGYAGGMFAILIIRQDWLRQSLFELVCITGGAASALVGVVLAFLALRIRTWEWPSERDWFERSEFDDVYRLRVFYLVSMLETHRKHSKINDDKARFAESAQWALAVAAGGLFLALLIGLVRAFAFPAAA